MSRTSVNRYSQILEYIFHKNYRPDTVSVEFQRDEIAKAAAALNVAVPKNLGDVVYSFRYRQTCPESIQATAPEGKEWTIRPRGRGLYSFELINPLHLFLGDEQAVKVPDSTPSLIRDHAISDEQATLSILRYCRLIDIFTGLTCYSLQNHLRTSVPNIGQIETDEIYLGIDGDGRRYILPVQAKGPNDLLNQVQIEQDIAMCEHKFPDLQHRPIGVQKLNGDRIALYEFAGTATRVKIAKTKIFEIV